MNDMQCMHSGHTIYRVIQALRWVTLGARQALLQAPWGMRLLMTLASATNTSMRSPPFMRSNRKYRWYLSWKLAYWRMQKGWAVLRVMACSQKTCSGHCTTADFRMRFKAYALSVDSSAAQKTQPDLVCNKT